MSASLILIIILVLISLDFVIDQGLKYLNLKNSSPALPDELRGIYDEEKYVKSIAYQKENTRLSFLSSTLSFLISFIMILTGAFGWVDSWVRSWMHIDYFIPLAFFGVLIIAVDIISFPFQWYRTFVIEEKYGFNKTTVKTFIIDKIKGYLLGGLIGGGLLLLLIYLINSLGAQFWIWFLLVIVGFILFTNMFLLSKEN